MQRVGGVRVQRAPGPDRSSIETSYGWSGQFGSQPGIVRRFVDPMALVGEMISPFPRTQLKKRNALVGIPPSNAVQTLSVAAPTQAPAPVAPSHQPEPAAAQAPEPAVVENEQMGLAERQTPSVAKEELFEDAPEVPESYDTGIEEAPQAAPTPDAQVAAMEDIADSQSMVLAERQPPPDTNDMVLGRQESSAASAGVAPAPLQLEWYGSFPDDEEMSDLQLLFDSGVEWANQSQGELATQAPRRISSRARDITQRYPRVAYQREPRTVARTTTDRRTPFVTIQAIPAQAGVVQVGGVIQVPPPMSSTAVMQLDQQVPDTEVAGPPGRAMMYELPDDTASVSSGGTVSKPYKQRKKREGQIASGSTAAVPAVKTLRKQKGKVSKSAGEEAAGEDTKGKGKRRAE